MRLYIGNLPDWITDPQLYELALPFGKPQAANIARYLVGGKSKGFGYIDYATREEGRAAIAGLNGREIDGQRLTVYEATAVRARPWSDKSSRSRR
ncbi:MAG TPA: RNA-binding protein [Thermoanaerobaculia bacterium]